MKNNYILNYDWYMINEADDVKIPLKLSEKLVNILIKIKSEPIAKKLLDTNNSGSFDSSYLDIDKDSKMVTYFPVDRLSRIENELEVWSKYRQSTSWGKMINKLFPNEFTALDIDRFYNRYRPEIDIKENESKRFKVVHGEDIRYWYLHTRWESSFGSCMQGEKAQPFFDIYCKNPEKCGLLIYFSETKPDKIIGRSLIWNNLLKPSGDTIEDKNPYTLMDRVYFTSNNSSQIEAAFHKYAIDNEWIYKRGDQFLMNGTRKTTSVATRLKPVDYKYYPYVDTMSYYTPETGRAASTPGNPAKDPKTGKLLQRYNLKNQDGSKSPIDR